MNPLISVSSCLFAPPSSYLLPRKALCISALFSLLLPFRADLALAADNNLDFSDLSLEQLMNLEVTTVSRKPEPLAETAAAVYVISNEDIQQSGATNIADVLRMAPGVQVAKVSSHTWAVSIRGFNDRFSDKLLVLMDGRTLYNPLHSGVTWEIQDMILEDIAQIEVIRGPGAAMWGANAVNGVINIISKNSADTKGALVTAAAGDYEQFHGQVRYGGTLADSTSYRLYGKYLLRDGGKDTTAFEGDDSWYSSQGGFRLDHTFSPESTLSLQGALYKADLNDLTVIADTPLLPLPVPAQHSWEMSGYHVLGEWQKSNAKDNKLQTRVYWDTTDTDSILWNEKRNTFDVDFQHIFSIGKLQNISWGMEYRYSNDSVNETYHIRPLNDSSRSDNLYSAFLQDEITLLDQQLKVTIGSKFEHNDYTGFEIQPSIRTAWLPRYNHSFWAAVSRAVHTPSRYEHDGSIYSPILVNPENGMPTIEVFRSNPDFDAEELIAYEGGYRFFANTRFSFDLALFYNDYTELAAIVAGPPETIATPAGPVLTQPYTRTNDLSGSTWGGELVVDFLPQQWWRIQAVFSYLKMDLENDADRDDNRPYTLEKTSPGSQFSIRSFMALPHNVSLNLWLRYVSSLPAENTDSYWDGDVRVSWKPVNNLEISLVGQNLLHDSHKEMEQTAYLSFATERERSAYLKLSWSY